MDLRGTRSYCRSQECRALLSGSSSERGASPRAINRTKTIVRVAFRPCEDVFGVPFRSSEHRADQEGRDKNQGSIHCKL